ncbi:MAG TPA: hypothetical protein VFV91_07350 [Gaiellaceae bacterium]|nr:hypothetical protein [Gaiellaceae bacterium]
MHEHERKPIWTSATFLVYTGGLTVLLGGLLALGYLSNLYGKGAKTGWALLILVILYGIAHGLRIRKRPIAAGIFAFASVIAWGALVIFAFEWWGLSGVNAGLNHWSWARTVAILLILAAARDDRRRFNFPFIEVISAVLGFVFVLDLLPAGGNWTAVWALIVGLLYLVAGMVRSEPSAFWLHFVGGALIGGAVLHWAHTTDGNYAVVSIVAFLFVLTAYATKRSSWAVFGAIGFYIATIHYIVGSPTALAEGFFGLGSGGSSVCHSTGQGGTVCTSTGGGINSISPWSPALAFGLLGFFLVALGLLGRRRTAATLAPPAA